MNLADLSAPQNSMPPTPAAPVPLRVPRSPFVLPILVVYIVLAVIYSAVTPMFEAPDENFHFAYIQRVAYTGQLPYQDPAVTEPWYQEGSQPPLYYLLSAPLIRLVPAEYEQYPLHLNPLGQVGIGLASVNNNHFLHTPAEAFPWQGVPLQLHIVRLFSVLLGGMTLYALYRAARLAFPDMPGLAVIAMAFAAFNPMFLFMSGSINNDNLVTMLASVSLWQMLALLREGYSLRRAVLLAVILALAGLSKISGFTLLPVYGALLVAMFWKRRLTLRQVLDSAMLFVLAFALLAAWWFVRNIQLYGDVTGLSRMIAIILPRQTPYTVETMLREMQGLRISFWALFGWLNVIGPTWFHTVMDVLTALAMLGGIVWVVRRWLSRQYDVLLPVGLLGLLLAVVFASLINWTRMTPATQGRLLMPSMVGIATLTALGWITAARGLVAMFTWIGRRLRLAGRAAMGPRRGYVLAVAGLPLVIMLVVAALSPSLTIWPAYAPPLIVGSLPEDAVAVDVRFDKINVLGFRIDPTPILPGQSLPVTLYYQGEPDSRNLALFLTAFDRDGKEVGKLDTYPGRGMLPTSYLVPGKLYEDKYKLKISATAHGPVQAMIELGWWNLSNKERVKPVQADGKPLDALILRGGTILANDRPELPTVAQPVVFSGALRLNGYTLTPPDGLIHPGDTLHVSLNWEGLSRVYENFTVFVHLEDENGESHAQGDGPPWYGHYPTSAWAPGQPFDDPHGLTLPAETPPGQYRLVIGLYRPADNTRLPADSGGDSIILSTPITVQTR